MNIRFDKYISLAVAVIAFGACDLDLTPTDGIVYQEGKPLFLTQADINSFDNGLHATFRSLYYGVDSQTQELMCDGFNATQNYNGHYDFIHRADDSFTTSDSDVESIWGANYIAIKNYNIVINSADNVSDDLRASARIMKGHAYFYRACSYLTLIRHFAKAYNESTASSDLGVPLVLEYNQLEKPARSSVQAVYDAIKADLDSASVILANQAGSPRSDVPTIDAVNAVYARYYLDVKNYPKAAESAELVINSSAKYALASNSDEMELEYVQDGGNEPIMQMYASKTEGAAANLMYLGEGGVGNDSKVGKYFASYYIPTKNLLDKYEIKDVRYNAWFTTKYPFRYSGSTFQKGIIVFVKYLGNPNLYSGELETGAQSVKPLLIGEQYLIAAEAYFQSGETAQAKAELNALQTKRGATLTSATLENIKTEWFKETVGEGLRMSCLKRWGDGTEPRTPQTTAAEKGIIITGASFDKRVLSADDYHFNWPIPQYEVRVNPNLVPNPGYSD